MSGFHIKNGVLHVDDVDLRDLAKEFGTPAYVYSASVIRAQYEALAGAMRDALPADRQPLLCYACKANSNIAVLKLLQSLGSSIEVVSKGELLRAVKAGFDPEKIVFEGVGKSRADIESGLDANVHQFNIESLAELRLINDIAGQKGKVAKVVFRLNPDVETGTHAKIATGKKGGKFGLSPEKVEDGYKLAEDLGNVQPLGIFTHIGSQISNTDSFENLFHKLADFVSVLRERGHKVTRLDIGGGFPIKYQDEPLLDIKSYAQAVRDIILPLDVEIIMEPGRFLVGNAGVLLTEVLYNKESYGENFLIVDSSMSELMRPALYDAWHAIEPVANRDAPTKTYNVVGPVCESSDIFAKGRELPEMLGGDLAVIHTTGAYGFCMASNYNTRPTPPEILVEGTRYHVIRPRQTYDDIIGSETIPDWL